MAETCTGGVLTAILTCSTGIAIVAAETEIETGTATTTAGENAHGP